ncbi:MAG: hypothetical protein PWR31_2064 [Bacillota bacterium]|nr:hypothetical protein [Bacillota bacterium]
MNRAPRDGKSVGVQSIVPPLHTNEFWTMKARGRFENRPRALRICEEVEYENT